MQSPANFKPDQVVSRTRALGGNNCRKDCGPQGPVHWGTSSCSNWDLEASLAQSDQGWLLGESLSACVSETLAKPHPEIQS